MGAEYKRVDEPAAGGEWDAYAALFEALPYPATLIDAQGIVVDVNQAFLDHAHRHEETLRKEERVGRPVVDFTSDPESRRLVEKLLREVLEGGAQSSIQHRVVDRAEAEATSHYVEVRGRALRDAAGRVRGAVLLSEDVSGAMRQQHKRRLLADLREAVMEMKVEGDIEKILLQLRDGLEELGVPLQACGINLVDPQAAHPGVRFYNLLERFWEGYTPDHSSSVLLDIWRRKEVCYRSDLEADDPFREREQLSDSYGFSVRSVIDVPFAHGTLALNSARPDAFSPADIEILQEMAQILSESFARLDDMRRISLSEERYRTLVETPDWIVMLITPDGHYVYVNPHIARLVGFRPGDFYEDPDTIYRITDRQGRRSGAACFRRALQGLSTRNWEFRWRHREGHWGWASGSVFPIRNAEGKVVLVQVVYHDITRHKELEQSLEIRVRQQAMVSELGQLALREEALSGLMDEAATILARGLQVEYTKVLEWLPDEQVLLLRAGVGWRQGLVGRARIEDGADTQAGYTLLHREPIVVEDQVEEKRFERPPLLVDHGVLSGMSAVIEGGERPFGVLGIHTRNRRTFAANDIHFFQAVAHVLAGAIVRRQAEEALAQNRVYLQAIFNNTQDAILIADGEGRYRDANPAACELTGYAREELLQLRVQDILVSPEGADAQEVWQAFLRVGEMRGESQVKCRDGSTREVEFNAVAHFLPGLHLSALRDMAERRRAEEERLRTQRLRTLAQIAAGVSHNLNNILVGVLGPAQLLRRASRDPGVQEEVEAIITAALRAQELVRRLNQSVHGEPADALYPVPVEQAVDQALQTARPRWKDEAEARGIAIEVICDLGEIPPVRATLSGLHDALVNLIFNAVDAMPRGGRLQVRSRLQGERVRVEVRDSGIGMNAEVRERAFDPFFSTKGDVGSGLGLATVRSAVEGWGGSVAVDSAPGQGSTFALSLPVWVEEERALPPAEPAFQESRRARVWIVDDEVEVRRTLELLLSMRHETRVLQSGPEALAAFSEGCCDVVMVDLGMPEMAGDQVVRRLREVDPDLVAVLITGWELAPEDPRQKVFDFYLHKPFGSLEEIEQVLARAVELRDRRAGR